MAPKHALPIPDEFDTVEAYVESLLDFATTNILFQTLCGGVHILDFFTRENALFEEIIPESWQQWLLTRDTMDLLYRLMRADLDSDWTKDAPPSLVEYIKNIRNHCLVRTHNPRMSKQAKLPRHVAVGMIPKKVHEVVSFASYVDNLAEDIAIQSKQKITHFVDFGSGQNYLGRALASPPYNKNIVAVESREHNISGAKGMDVLAKLAEREVVMRNKKLWRQQMEEKRAKQDEKDTIQSPEETSSVAANVADLRPSRELATIYTQSEGKGSIQYVEHMIYDGDLSDVVEQITKPKEVVLTEKLTPSEEDKPSTTLVAKPETDPRLIAMSIHSCGNLSHHGIRSLLLNPAVQAIAIVGCCYNLLTEKLGPPTFKLPILRPNMRAVNGHQRAFEKIPEADPHGYPMSNRVSTHAGDGIRLNITARMMAVQAPQNWTEKESDAFFTRHFFRALLQKVFLDFGVVSKPNLRSDNDEALSTGGTEAVIIGSLRKGCYVDFVSYVRGAIHKLRSHPERATPRVEKLADITDAQIQAYADEYAPRKKELSVMWSLMAFSAGVVESLIVVDRWLYLKESTELVRDAWVEAVFDYQQSPRNLVVVGIKR